MFDTVGFIGSGRIARIMVGGWKKAGAMPATIFAYDANPAAVAALREDDPAVKAARLDEAAGADLVFGALHPPALLEVLPTVAGLLKDDALFCSLAPKVKLAALTATLGGFSRVARMNPNSPSIIGQGFNPLAFGADLPSVAREALLRVLAPLGQSPQVDERWLETYAVISAMGPTYFGFQFAEVERLAESFGLTPDAARAAVRQMLHGTVDLLFASDLPRRQALDLVPVRPLAEQEAEIVGMLQKQIGGMHAKLTG